MGKKLLKVFGTLAAAILIGAIGSGVWETLLKPLLQNTAETIVVLFSWVSSTFKDSVYREAAVGFHEKYSLTLVIFIYGVTSGVLFIKLNENLLRSWLRKNLKASKEMDDITTKSMMINFFIVAILTLSILSMGIFITARESYINRITTWSLTSIERLNTSVSASEYAELKTQFYRVNDANDFYAFHLNLKQAADQKGVKLRAFEPL
jgi:hypothetical protein